MAWPRSFFARPGRYECGSAYRRQDRSYSLHILLLPACFSHTRNLTTHGEFTELDTCQTEFTECATWTAGHRAAVTLAGRRRVARQCLQLQTGFITFFFRLRLVIDDGFQSGTLRGEFLHQVCTLLF